MTRILSLLAALTLSGCVVSEFDHTLVSDQLQDSLVESAKVTDEDVREAQALRPQLAFPCKIAVFLRGEPGYSWRWSIQDKTAIDSWGDTLKKEGIASEVFRITDMFMPNKCGLKELRVAAAKHGADALLVIQGASQTDSYVNPAALLNLTVVGGYLVPASHRDSLFVMQGVLIDVSNGFLYAAVESEGQGKIIRPTFVIQDRDAIDRAKQEAVSQFGPALLRRMNHLRGIPPGLVYLTPPAPPVRLSVQTP
jgi:rhombotail lipoprotein